MRPRIQWLEVAEISRIAFGVTKDEVERVLQEGHDEPDAANLLKGRRLKLGKLKDGRTIRVEYASSLDGRWMTVQLVVLAPERLQQ